MRVRVGGGQSERASISASRSVAVFVIVLALATLVLRILDLPQMVRAGSAAPQAWSSVGLWLTASKARRTGTSLPAKINPHLVFSIGAETYARVGSVMVAPGASVQSGQVLAVLENPDLIAERQRVQLRLKLAEKQLQALESAGQGGLRLRIQREQYRGAARAWQAAQTRSSDYSSAENERSHATAKAKLERYRGLLERQLITAPEFEAVRREERNEARLLREAQDRVVHLKSEAESAESNLRLAQMHLDLLEGTDLPVARMAFEEALAAFRAVTRKIETLTVVSPRAGTVLQANVQPGDRVWEGTAMFQLADLTRLDLVVPVTASMAKVITPGSDVKVRLPTEPPTELLAAVSSRVLIPDPQQQSYLVRVTIPNPDPSTVLVGLEGAVEFLHGEKR